MNGRPWYLAGGLAPVGVALLLGPAGCSGNPAEDSHRRAGDSSAAAVGPSRSSTDPGPLNGRITHARTHFGVGVSAYGWRAFDPVSEKALFVTGPIGKNAEHHLRRLGVVGPTGRIAILTCGRALVCAKNDWLSYPATLGPGADEVTLRSGASEARVIGYDGTLRRTIDLGATTGAGAEVSGLRWSASGDRLAVLTAEDPFVAGVSRVWLVDRDSGHAQLAYSLSAPGSPTAARDASDGPGYFWPATGWGWSPDGRTLLLEVRTRNSLHGADVVVLRLQPKGAADPVIAQTLYHSDRHFDWAGNVAWSPDGTRIAVRTRKHVNEISAGDGRVLARHPQIEGWLVWPAREG